MDKRLEKKRREMRVESVADSLKGKLLLWVSTSRLTTEPLDGDLGIFNVVRGYVCGRYQSSRNQSTSCFSLRKRFSFSGKILRYLELRSTSFPVSQS